jgi:CheY-like chemotaxis protein
MATPPAPADKRIILVADDDVDSLDMLKIMIERQGHEVLTAASGREAIEKVIDVQPDLVLLDIMMPEVDGSAVCRRIKENDLLRRIKVILYTAKEKVRGKEIARKVGADAFIAKPFEPEFLWNTLKDLLAQQDKEGPKLTKKLGL